VIPSKSPNDPREFPGISPELLGDIPTEFLGYPKRLYRYSVVLARDVRRMQKTAARSARSTLSLCFQRLKRWTCHFSTCARSTRCARSTPERWRFQIVKDLIPVPAGRLDRRFLEKSPVLSLIPHMEV